MPTVDRHLKNVLGWKKRDLQKRKRSNFDLLLQLDRSYRFEVLAAAPEDGQEKPEIEIEENVNEQELDIRRRVVT